MRWKRRSVAHGGRSGRGRRLATAAAAAAALAVTIGRDLLKHGLKAIEFAGRLLVVNGHEHGRATSCLA